MFIIEIIADQQQFSYYTGRSLFYQQISKTKDNSRVQHQVAVSPSPSSSSSSSQSSPQSSYSTSSGSNHDSPSQRRRITQKDQLEQVNGFLHSTNHFINTEQSFKHSNREYIDGFNQSGLFSLSRHPNFLAECSLWWIYSGYCFFYIFEYFKPQFNVFLTAADGKLIDYFSFHNAEHLLNILIGSLNNFYTTLIIDHNWYQLVRHPLFIFLGPIFLTLIFLGSTPLTEEISSKKYKNYSKYQQLVPRLIPNPFSVGQKVVDYLFNRSPL
jgi:protein-S-isoprenylcysteine O-methyltransferase Ste14